MSSGGGEVSSMPIQSSLQHRGKNVSDSRSTFRPLTAIKVRTLRNVAVGSENQLHVLDNALEGEGREETVITGAYTEAETACCCGKRAASGASHRERLALSRSEVLVRQRKWQLERRAR